jgi:TonB family protein
VKTSSLLVAGLFAASLLAVAPSARAMPPSLPDPAAVAAWKASLQEVDKNLRSAQWAPALEADDADLRAMRSHIEGGAGAGQLLALALLLKAVAEEGLDRADDAFWDWQMAMSLDPRVGQVDLGVYGEVGHRLAARVAPELAAPAKDAAPTADSPWARAHSMPPADSPLSAGVVTKPVKISGITPEYPGAAGKACKEGRVVIESVLDATGKVTKFHVVETASPLLTLASLEAVRQWRFEPARRDGTPVAVYYSLTVDFKTRSCMPHG